jgi:hypothetical protein
MSKNKEINLDNNYSNKVKTIMTELNEAEEKDKRRLRLTTNEYKKLISIGELDNYRFSPHKISQFLYEWRSWKEIQYLG